MKQCLITLALVLTFSWGVQGQKKAFEPGVLWLDTDGTHINAHGGGLLYDQGYYYWYGEHKDHNSLAQVGVNVYRSKDLYTWVKKGVALAVSEDPDSEITSGCVMERPKVIYNEKTDKYVMWFHLELKDRKSTRLNSSHVKTSYAVFCLKKNMHSVQRAATEREASATIFSSISLSLFMSWTVSVSPVSRSA